MNRYDKRDKMPRVKPVQKIELSEKHFNLKLILVVAFLAIGVTLIIYALMQALSTDPGWQDIEVNSSKEENCSAEFVFRYYLGGSGISSSKEYKQISALYTDATVKAHQLFNSEKTFDDTHNVCYINEHVNEVIEVDAVLYQAFSLLQEYDNRCLYLAPVYADYNNMFYSSFDYEAENFDPYLNEETAKFFSEVVVYINDPTQIELELLGDNQIRLNVSESYLRYAEEMGITSFIDFFWLKNAFIIDYLADVMTENGYTLGVISSYDGYSRNLDQRDTTYALNLFDRVGLSIYPAGVMTYSQPVSIVFLRDFAMSSLDVQHYYERENGEVRSAYIDPTDGLCKSANSNLVGYSRTAGCAETVLNLIPIYIADALDTEMLYELPQKKIEFLYCADAVIFYSDASVTISELYDNGQVRYSPSYVGK